MSLSTPANEQATAKADRHPIPWRVEPAGYQLVNILDARNHPMACMVDAGPAKLMVLAPQLLDALHRTVQLLADWEHIEDDHVADALATARDLIARATGQPST